MGYHNSYFKVDSVGAFGDGRANRWGNSSDQESICVTEGVTRSEGITRINQSVRYASSAILGLGVLVLAQGAIAFFFRHNVLTGTKYGPSLMPVYIIFTGIGILVVGLTIKTIADRKNRQG